MQFRAFKGWRPPDELAHRVAAVPYDVVDTEEARALAVDEPLSLLHVTRPDIDLPADADHHGEAAYNQAREAFMGLLARGALVQEPGRAFYAYAQKMGDHRQLGLVGLAHTADYAADLIKKHEYTRPDKEDDRMNHLLAVGAHLGPVFLTYRGQADIDSLIAEATQGDPAVDYTAPDGVQHTLWPILEEGTVEALEAAFTDVPAFYVADGHHRTAAAARVGLERSDLPEAQWFLTVVFPDDQLRILAYNRVVNDLAGHSPEGLLDALKGQFTVTPLDGAADPEARHTFTMCLAGTWYSLKPTFEIDESDPVNSLDVSVLQDTVLAPLLNIEDPRRDTRIQFVGGIRGVDELTRRVAAQPQPAVAFALYPTSLDELIRISDAGMIMPPKSTWFEPKLRSGLVVNRFA